MRISVGGLLLLMWLGAGCTSSMPANPLAPAIRVEQLPASEFEVRQQGAVSIAYRMTIRNPAAEAISLKQIEMKTVNRSPYSLRNTPATVEERIGPGEEKVLTFSLWADPLEGPAKPHAMVWVEGTASFEGSKGPFRTAFSQSFRQP